MRPTSSISRLSCLASARIPAAASRLAGLYSGRAWKPTRGASGLEPRAREEARNSPAHSVVDVHLVLCREDLILIGLRAGTGYMDGYFHLPAGHLEPGESACAAAVREGREELGVELNAADLKLMHVTHQQAGVSRLGLFFLAYASPHEVTNREPQKCAELRWVEWDALPDNIVPYLPRVLAHIRAETRYSAVGWAAAHDEAA